MAPTAARWSPLALLFLVLPLLAATAPNTAAEHNKPPSDSDSDPPPPPSPTPWPERFHAVLFTNLTNYSAATTGPPLRVTDLYYDWPRRRNLNLVRHQLSPDDDPLYDMEWNNGTTFYFDSKSCRVERFPVGVLPPWWLSGAEYLGRRVAGGIDCHVWAKAGFIFYYEEATTGRPVRWDFVDVTGIQQFVMIFEPGVELEDDAQWQAPAYCFADDNDEEEGKGKGNDDTSRSRSRGEEAGDDGLEAASRLLRKLAGAAATS